MRPLPRPASFGGGLPGFFSVLDPTIERSILMPLRVLTIERLTSHAFRLLTYLTIERVTLLLLRPRTLLTFECVTALPFCLLTHLLS